MENSTLTQEVLLNKVNMVIAALNRLCVLITRGPEISTPQSWVEFLEYQVLEGMTVVGRMPRELQFSQKTFDKLVEELKKRELVYTRKGKTLVIYSGIKVRRTPWLHGNENNIVY